MSIDIKFTIIIPTRDRCSTLQSTLLTCLKQDYSNFEIIISDNFSDDNTKHFIYALNHPKVKYINTGKRLGMSQNWEFALDSITGEYVTFLGDDDALLPGALSDIKNIISRTKTKAITWTQASYNWPNHIIVKDRNVLTIPLSNELEIRNAQDYLARVLNFEVGCDQISFLYKGMIHKSVIDEIKKASGGKFFHSQIPDIYASIALTSTLDTYCFSKKPYSVNGASSNSNGTSQFNQDISSTESNKFSSEDNIPFHPKTTFCPSIPIILAECFYQARERLPNLNNKYQIDQKKLIEEILKDALSSQKWRFTQISKAILTMAHSNKWDEFMPMIKRKISLYQEQPISQNRQFGYSMRGNEFTVDGAKFFINDVYDATLFCGFILNREYAGLTFNKLQSHKLALKRKFHKLISKIRAKIYFFN